MKANLERENKTEGEQWMAIGCLGHGERQRRQFFW